MNLLLHDINIKESIEIAKDELNFLKTYINSNTLENYISLTSTSLIQINKNRNYIQSDKKILSAIEIQDYHKKLIYERIQAILKLDYPYNTLLIKKYVEKKLDEEINEEMGFSDSTRKRKLKDAYLQFAFQLDIVQYNVLCEDSFEYDSLESKILEFCAKPKTRSEIQFYCNIHSRPYFCQTYLKPLLEDNKLLMLYPDKPKSKKQRYYTNRKKDA